MRTTTGSDGGFATLRIDRDERTLVVTLDRPDDLNSLTEQALDELEQVLDLVQLDTSIRALVLTGRGRAFCVGLDAELLDGAFASRAVWEHVVRRVGAVGLRLERLPVPVIAAVNGYARAGGFELLLACDLVLVAESARVGDVHTTFGVVPAGGSTIRLPRVVGAARAREIFLTGRWLCAAECVEYGLAIRAVPDAELRSAAATLAGQLVDKPRECLAALKRQWARTEGMTVAGGLPTEIEEFLDYVTPAGSPAQEGFRAWREGRPPDWR